SRFSLSVRCSKEITQGFQGLYVIEDYFENSEQRKEDNHPCDSPYHSSGDDTENRPQRIEVIFPSDYVVFNKVVIDGLYSYHYNSCPQGCLDILCEQPHQYGNKSAEHSSEIRN